MSDTPLSDVPPSSPAEGGTDSPAAVLQRERDELYDRLLRTTAEFDNFRKRTERERREFAEWAAAAPPEAQKFREGVELIHRQLMEVVKKRGVQPLTVVGEDFDPTLHQAVAYDETPGARDGEVVAELRRGYRLGEKLLRPALVRVAKAS